MKKVFAVLVALTLVLTMGTMALAAGNGKITIGNALEGETYSIYKVLDFTPVEGSETNGRYSVVEAWKAFVAGEGAAYLKENTDIGTIEWVGEETELRKAEFAKLVVAYAKANGIAAVASKTAGAEGGVEFTGLDLGYYAVDTSLGALCALTTTTPNATVNEKNTGGTVTKEVQENSDSSWGETNDANIGDTVNFKATITAGKGTVNYVMHDTMSAGLTFNKASVVVKNGDTTLVLGDDYTILDNCGVEGCDCTFAIDLTDAFEKDFEENETVVVEYSAVLNENAEIAGEGNPNEVYLTYGDAQKTTKDTTVTYTFQFQLVKTVADGTVLPGATFLLYDAETDGNLIEVVKVSDGIYRVAKEGETGVEIEAGYVTIQGLDSDTYYLEETKAPDGYNKLTTRQSVTINAANNDAKVTNNKYENGGIQVINKTGSLLPETGGIGTTIFYIVGIVLMLGAGIILISKKRMASFA